MALFPMARKRGLGQPFDYFSHWNIARAMPAMLSHMARTVKVGAVRLKGFRPSLTDDVPGIRSRSKVKIRHAG